MGSQAEFVEPEGYLTALVVASGRTERLSVVRRLRSVGFQVVAASDPHHALLQFRKRRTRLLVLSLDGLVRRDRDLLRELRRLAPHLRVLLLAPASRRSDVGVFLAAGADAWLPTPGYPRELGLVAHALIRTEGRDSLTGLPDRSAFDADATREIARAQREKHTLGIGHLKLDDFSHVNLVYGSPAGDFVLREVARRLRAEFRVPDPVCRFGQDEFAVVLTGLARDPEDARKEAFCALNRARERIASHPFLTPTGVQVKPQVTVSISLVLVPPYRAMDAE